MEAKDLKKQLQEADQMLQTQKQDLAKEVEFRKEMEGNGLRRKKNINLKL